ncbi:hypothetical protein [Amycolatopsis cihanbeyliensis]|uniref:Uncharacterized protein n=1 Tax=Amycolatopsis cihanbeyliensis TaxID=1128664 RepID=A0A542DHR9_AMYCI|nr:hypothetical protein [Amycolatopsis cihanbeyliensis]TQJ02638.1 hypothetical protein FB471_2373 [Amycolatopsis cihanbeyliensis]
MAPVQSAVMLLAQQQPDGGDGGGQGQDFGKSSPVGLLVLILFLIAVALLVRSMTKHLKRLPASFDKEAPAEREGDDEGDRADAESATGAAGDPEPAEPEQRAEATDQEQGQRT